MTCSARRIRYFQVLVRRRQHGPQGGRDVYAPPRRLCGRLIGIHPDGVLHVSDEARHSGWAVAGTRPRSDRRTKAAVSGLRATSA